MNVIVEDGETGRRGETVKAAGSASTRGFLPVGRLRSCAVATIQSASGPLRSSAVDAVVPVPVIAGTIAPRTAESVAPTVGEHRTALRTTARDQTVDVQHPRRAHEPTPGVPHVRPSALP